METAAGHVVAGAKGELEESILTKDLRAAFSAGEN